MADPPIEILHIGSASRDITGDDSRGWRLGGGASYAALTTARLGLQTAAVVGVDATAATADELDMLRAAGVAVLAVPLAESPAFHNIETPDGRLQICVAPGEPLPIFELPEGWRAAAAWSIVPVAAEVGDDWASQIPADALVSVGWQGWLRVLIAGQTVTRRPPASSRLLRRANLVGVSRHDVAPETQPDDLATLLQPGADLLVTEGNLGGQLLRVGVVAGGETHDEADQALERARHYVAIESDGEIDPTGAGDTFLGALLASRIRPSLVPDGEVDREAQLAFAAAAASLVIEDVGLLGVPDLDAVQARYRRRTVAAQRESTA